MSYEIIKTTIAVLGGGGIVAIINAFANRNKNNSDIAQSNIETAIKLKNSAIEEYNSVENKLKEARRLLDEVQLELDNAKRYINVLTRILDEKRIEYPNFKEGVTTYDFSVSFKNKRK